MNKKLIIQILITITLIWIFIFWIFIFKYKTASNIWDINNENQILIDSWILQDDINKLSKDEINSKIDNLKKKISLRWVINKWDLYYEKEEFTIALTKYLQILKEIPNDEEIINKIANVYFELKQYDKAYNYYSQIKNYSNLEKNKAINSLFFSYTNNFNKETTDFISSEIDKFNLDKNSDFYYKNSLVCIEDFSLCKLHFQEYFKLNITNNLSDSWTLSLTWWIEDEKNPYLENIKNSLVNYENFKLEDLSYKGALVSWAFFTNWLYPIAIETSKKILLEKNDYRPILKIIAKSYYELWLYDYAKDFLIQYTKFDDKDAEISYFLWVIYQRLRDYVLSSIHLKKAIDLWYPNSLVAKRRIIFNYSEVWETKKFLNSFEDLITTETDKIEIEDFNLAIYFHIINKKLEIAKKITDIWIEKFEDKSLFFAYLWWINLEENWTIEWAIDLAEKNLNKSYELNKNNSMTNYLLWLLELKKENKAKAIVYFKNSIILDEKWEFWIRSNDILKTLN